jgi:hypothetical protein
LNAGKNAGIPLTYEECIDEVVRLRCALDKFSQESNEPRQGRIRSHQSEHQMKDGTGDEIK